MRDSIEYASPLGVLGWAADKLVLRRFLTRLIDARNSWLRQELDSSRD